MQHQHALALGALDRHEPHGRPGDRFADRLGVGGVVLLTPNIGLHVAGRHQPNLVAQRRDLPRPVVCRSTGFHTNQAGRKGPEELQHLGAPQLPPDRNLARVIDAVDLEDALGEIKTDSGNLHGGRLLLEVASQRPSYGAQTPDTGAVHPISPTATRLHLAAMIPTRRLPLAHDLSPLSQGG